MTSESALEVNADVSIPRLELTFRATRAGGPGGQHVNTSSTRVELTWNVERSRALTTEQRARVREALSSRIDAQGNVRVVASAFRSQARNREDAEDKLTDMVRGALVIPKARRKTRPTKGSVEQRLLSKKKLSDKKRHRRPSVGDE